MKLTDIKGSRRLITRLVLTVGLITIPNFILAQVSAPESLITSITRVTDVPTIDGVISEGEWTDAVLIDDFHQVNPIEYGEPSERTEAYLMYTADAIFVAARLYDSEPELLSAHVLRQGDTLRAEDRFKIMLDPYNDKRSGYQFEANPNSIRGGGIYKNATVDRDWEGIFNVASQRTNFGWSIEFEIPFKTLSFDGEGDWGFNLTRIIPRKNETVSWVSRNRQYGPPQSGVLTGLTNLSQGVGLDIVPSLSAVGRRDYQLDDDELKVEPSLDLFYKLTPSINGSLTFNTDFSATEVDNRQVDLSRFSLFFPDKRAFFLRESDIFEFGGIGGVVNNSTTGRADRENARPYFSRRIGLSAEGAPVDLDVGAKVSGRQGPINFGLMTLRQAEAQTDDGLVDATTLSVARASVNILRESNIGFIATRGDPRSNLDNSLYGLDFRYRNTGLAQGRSVESDIWYQQTDTDGVEGKDSAYGAAISSPNRTGLRGMFSYRRVEENFIPAIGFVSRANVDQYIGQVGYTKRFSSGWLQSVYSGVDGQRVNVIDGDLQSENILFRLFEFENVSGDEVTLRVDAKKENLLTDFEISDGIVIPADEYSFSDVELAIQTARQRSYDIEFSYLRGDFYNGDIDTISAEVNWRPSKHYQIGASYTVDNVELPNGKFSTKLATANFNVMFSSSLSWVNLLQYDNVSESVGINSRLKWTPKAGQNFFFVINQNYVERADDPFNPNSRQSFHSDSSDITIKFDYTYRF